MLSPHTRTRLIYRNGKKVRAHRWIMEQHLGRKLLDDEQVHHKDGNPLNNALENLEVLSTREHMRLHKCQEWETRVCPVCGKPFEPTTRHKRRQMCCSAECAQAIRVRAMLRARGI